MMPSFISKQSHFYDLLHPQVMVDFLLTALTYVKRYKVMLCKIGLLMGKKIPCLCLKDKASSHNVAKYGRGKTTPYT